MEVLKRALRRVVREAAAGKSNVNVARRTNVVVASSVGKPGSINAVSVKQDAPIKQG